MKISILGCGWLGLPLAVFFRQKNFTVKGSTTRSEKLPLLKSYGIEPFLLHANPTVAPEKSPFFQSDCLVINIPPQVRQQSDIIFFEKKVISITENAIAGGATKIIFVSSTGIYRNNNKIVTEFDTPNPDTNSGIALEAAENYLKSLRNLDVTIVRPAGLIGKNRTGATFFSGQKNVAGGNSPINVIHQDDLIRVIYQIIRQEKWNETFNVCADQHPTKANFYTQQAEKSNLLPPHFDLQTEATFKIIDHQKLIFVLDYELLHPDPMKFYLADAAPTHTT